MSQYTFFPPSVVGSINIPGTVTVSNFPNPQAVTILTVPLPVGASTSDNQINGDQKTQIVDGSGNVIGSTANALDVNIASGVTLTVDLDNTTDNVLIYGFDGLVNRAIKTDAAGELQVDVLTSALPTGASTSALQVTGNASLASIDSKLTSPLSVIGPLTDAELRATPVPVSGTVTSNAGTGTFAVSAVSLPLPSGAATEATLAALNSKVVTVDTGAVVVASSALPAGASTSALQVSGNSSLASIDSKMPALGQNVMAGSMPVVIASDQSPIPVTGAFFQATQPVSGTVSATQSGVWTVGLSAGVNNIGDVDVLTMPVVQVGDNGGSLTVDGVFFQALQPVSGTVTANQGTPNTIANRWPVQGSDGTNSQLYTGTGAALVDGSGVTQPVSASSLPLPSGASTSALQTTGNTSLSNLDTNLNSVMAVDGSAVPAKTLMVGGTDGTNIQSLSVDTTGKLNINNISGVVSLPTGAATEATLVKLPLAQGSTTSGESGVLAMGAVTTSAPVYTTGQTSPLSISTLGRLRVSDNGSYTHINTATTVTHKSGAGVLSSVALNTKSSNGDTMTIYDNTAGSGTVIAVVTLGGTSVPPSIVRYSLNFSTGLTTVTTGTSDWTVVYQ